MPVTETVDGVERTYPCVESMTRFKVKGFAVRVWRDESTVGIYPNADLAAVADAICKEESSEFDMPHHVARRFAQVPRVSAVEVLDDNVDGIVLYVTW